MYKIILYFQSNIKGVFTKEEETATTESEIDRKYSRMLRRWVKILKPDYNETGDELDATLFGIIDDQIKLLNKNKPGDQKRSFYIKEYCDDIKLFMISTEN